MDEDEDQVVVHAVGAPPPPDREAWAREMGVDPATLPPWVGPPAASPPAPGDVSSQLLRARAAGTAMAADRARRAQGRGTWRAVFAVACAWGALGGFAVACFLVGRASVDEPEAPPPAVYIVDGQAEPATTSTSVAP